MEAPDRRPPLRARAQPVFRRSGGPPAMAAGPSMLRYGLVFYHSLAGCPSGLEMVNRVMLATRKTRWYLSLSASLSELV